MPQVARVLLPVLGRKSTGRGYLFGVEGGFVSLITGTVFDFTAAAVALFDVEDAGVAAILGVDELGDAFAVVPAGTFSRPVFASAAAPPPGAAGMGPAAP